VSTLDDLRADADRELLLDRCDVMHFDAEYFDPECRGCTERLEIAVEDDDPDAIAKLVGYGADPDVVAQLAGLNVGRAATGPR
jgi:hypothetical protein